MAAREKAIETSIRKMLRRRGAFSAKVWGGWFGETGLPDIFVCYRGRFLGVEVKTKTGQATERQKYVLAEIRKAEGIGVLVRSVKEVEKILDTIDTEIKW